MFKFSNLVDLSETWELVLQGLVFLIFLLVMWKKGKLTFSEGWRDLYDQLDAKIKSNSEEHEKQISHKNSEICVLRLKIESLEQELATSKVENSQLRMINNKLQIINMELNQQLATMKGDIDELKEEVKVRHQAFEMALESKKMLEALMTDADFRRIINRKRNETQNPDNYEVIDKIDSDKTK